MRKCCFKVCTVCHNCACEVGKVFLPKNDRGIFLNFSASVILLVPVSTYVARKVELYCQYVSAKSEQVL